MIEMHSHVLPGMDDGARNTEEATELLKALRKQGISSVVRTTHFYPNRRTLEDFVEQRTSSFAALTEAIKRQEAYETPPEAGAPFEAEPLPQPKTAASPATAAPAEAGAAPEAIAPPALILASEVLL